MSIYQKPKKVNYRKLWEQHHGPIPKDEFGRSFEIHHIDGNRNNNSLENLIAVSIQEHFDIHNSQGDIGACLAITMRMELTPEEISEMQKAFGKKSATKRLLDGTHNFLGPDTNKKRFESGEHPFLREDVQIKAREASSRSNKKRIANGTHHLLGGEIQKKSNRKKVIDGTHNFLGNKLYLKQMENGKHPTQIRKTCPHCGTTTNAGNYAKHHGDKCRTAKIEK